MFVILRIHQIFRPHIKQKRCVSRNRKNECNQRLATTKKRELSVVILGPSELLSKVYSKFRKNCFTTNQFNEKINTFVMIITIVRSFLEAQRCACRCSSSLNIRSKIENSCCYRCKWLLCWCCFRIIEWWQSVAPSWIFLEKLNSAQ